jgi:cytochrome c oxidase accessory protein FixG
MAGPDSLTTTSEAGTRIRVFPARPPRGGFWAVRRTWVQWGMILLYLAVPFIRIKGHPLLLLDIGNRRFSVFGHLFFAHEVPNLVFVITSFLFGIALITTLLGRAWCGWACPQTVFIERIFRAIEFWVIGDHLEQKRFHAAPPGFSKFKKRALKWTLFSCVALVLAHFFIAYFVGIGPAFAFILEGPSRHGVAFFWVMLMTAIVLFDFGWFREQFCLVACPYGRFQSVMMDAGSLFLAFDARRNDCINCNKCVAVCPTGIDVRNGLQFECIACAACADACDGVMRKIGKPERLVGYGSLQSLAGQNVRLKLNWIRGRTVIYGALLTISVSLLAWRLGDRNEFQQEITRAVDTPYQVIRDMQGRESVINHFKIRFYNLSWDPTGVGFELPESERSSGVEIIRVPGESETLMIGSGAGGESQFFLKVPKERFVDGHARSRIIGDWQKGRFRTEGEVVLVGP